MKKFINSVPKLMRNRQARRNSRSKKSRPTFGLNDSSMILVCCRK